MKKHLFVIIFFLLSWAIFAQSETAITNFIRGNMYFENNDYNRAIIEYTEAIRRNPNYVEAYNNRGVVYTINGDYDRAIADWEIVLQFFSKQFTSYGRH